MTIATALRASLLFACASAAAQKDASTIFACNVKAISVAERHRYNELARRVHQAMRDRTEISNGYSFCRCEAASRRRVSQALKMMVLSSFPMARLLTGVIPRPVWIARDEARI
jgi:hypothetical protein